MIKEGKKEKDAEANVEFNLKDTINKIKMPLHVAAVLLGIIGIMGTIILMLLSFPIIDNLETPVISQIESLNLAFDKAEVAVSNIENQLSTFNKSIGDLEASFESMKTSFKNTGESVRSFGEALESISLGQQGANIKNAGADLIKTSDSLGELSKDMKKNQVGLLELKNKMASIREGVAKQKDDLRAAGEAIKQTFSSMRVVITLFGILLIMIYLGIIAIAIAGLGS